MLECEYVQRVKQERLISKHTKSEAFTAGPVRGLWLRHHAHAHSRIVAQERAPNDVNRRRFKSAIPEMAEFG
jgi:hypothetical protein